MKVEVWIRRRHGFIEIYVKEPSLGEKPIIATFTGNSKIEEITAHCDKKDFDLKNPRYLTTV